MSLLLAQSYNENSATTIRDYSVNLDDGTGANMSMVSDTFGYYADFNGTTSKIDVTANDYSDTFTIFFEVYIDALTGTDYIFKKTNCFNVRIAGSTLTFEIDDGTTQYSVDAEFATATWTKFACTYSNANGIKIYKDNNTVVNSDANNLSLTRGGATSIGYDGTTAYYDGRLREFRIYNTELTSDNVASLMGSQQGITVGLTGHSFAVGDLVIQSDKNGNKSKAVVFATDTDEIRVLPMGTLPIYSGTYINRCGHRWDTARQDYFVLDGTASTPEVSIFDGVSVHSDLDSDTAKKIIINKDGVYKGTVTKTTTYTITNKDLRVNVDSSGGAFTVTLPSSPTANKEVEIIDSVGSCSTYTVTVNGNGNNIIGSTTALMNINYIAFSLVWNGTQWNLN